MSKFIKAGTIDDGTVINVNTEWSDAMYYIMKPYIKSQELYAFAFDDNNYKFPALEWQFIRDSRYIVFKECRTGCSVIVDPMDPITRRNLALYEVPQESVDEGGNAMGHRVEWFEVVENPFDNEFFKIGHPYKIKLRRNHPDVYAILTSLMPTEITFTYADDKDEGVARSTTITADEYRKLKPSFWFKALLPEDEWTSCDKETGDKNDNS